MVHLLLQNVVHLQMSRRKSGCVCVCVCVCERERGGVDREYLGSFVEGKLISWGFIHGKVIT